MYVCGITPYDATHIGHAATYVAFDLVQRAWRDAGHDVHYVQNVTDVDDPLLERAAATGEDWRTSAERETELFREDMAALRVLPPDALHRRGRVDPARSSTLIGELRRAGAAYDVDGDLYFSVAADPTFGDGRQARPRGRCWRCSPSAAATRTGPGKQDPLDPLLWRGQRAGRARLGRSPLGAGRPGWHIECAAIALQHLGDRLRRPGRRQRPGLPAPRDVRSRSRGRDRHARRSRGYVHAGMVGLDGEKMSKSRGNLVFVSTLREDGVDPMAIRLALLAHHYRTDWEWTAAQLTAAAERLDRGARRSRGGGGPDADARGRRRASSTGGRPRRPGCAGCRRRMGRAALSGGPTGGVDGAARDPGGHRRSASA